MSRLLGQVRNTRFCRDQNQLISEGLMPALVPYFGLITQLGECIPCKDEVKGSNPFRSTPDLVF